MFLFRKKKNEEEPLTETLRYEVGNVQGVGTRKGQEDSFTVVNALNEKSYNKSGLMFAVCDGMGGMKSGKLASESAIKCLRKAFSDMDMEGDIPSQMRDSIFSASSEVEKLLNGEGGSTVVMGIVFREKLYFACVGDSFLYLFRNGSLYRLNTEHNICHEKYLMSLRNGETDVNSGREAPDTASLTAFIGMPGLSLTDCSVRPLKLKKEDMIIACSDGIGGVLDEAEILEALNEPTVQKKCTRLEDFIMELANPNQDNYTALILKCL